MTPMLELKDFHYSYGAIHVLKGISMTVEQGETVALIGSNGAGKTTTLRAISGLVPAKGMQNEILFNGKPIQGMAANKIAALGIAHVFEGRHVFKKLSVAENLAAGAYLRKDSKAVAEDIEKVFKRFPRLEERKSQLAGTLSGGEQQMLAVGRALMSRPKLMMLDEPSLGLAPLVVQDIFSIIREINRQGVTVLLIEQNANMALKIADRAYVLKNGEIALSGKCSDLLNNEEVKSAYLGAK